MEQTERTRETHPILGEWNPAELEITGGNEEIAIEPLEGKDVQKVFNKAKSILDSVGCHYWVGAGTLLGLHRGDGFMPYDSDIDFETDYKDAYKIVKAFTKAGMPLCRITDYKKYPMQRCFWDNEQRIIVDVQFFHEGFYYNDHGIIRLPENYQNPEVYLEWRYGKDWRTPTGQKQDWGLDTKCLQ